MLRPGWRSVFQAHKEHQKPECCSAGQSSDGLNHHPTTTDQRPREFNRSDLARRVRSSSSEISAANNRLSLGLSQVAVSWMTHPKSLGEKHVFRSLSLLSDIFLHSCDGGRITGGPRVGRVLEVENAASRQMTAAGSIFGNDRRGDKLRSLRNGKRL